MVLSKIKSHPAWVCGLKLHHHCHYRNWILVTPCVGVWIETYSFFLKRKRILVTPCVGVWIETLVSALTIFPLMSHPAWVCGLKPVRQRQLILSRPCHTLRGCVDWNISFTVYWYLAASHTLRGCVDWNEHMEWKSRCADRHTLRGCVDWNRMRSWILPWWASHTLRGCVDWNTDRPSIIYRFHSHTLRGCVDWNRK